MSEEELLALLRGISNEKPSSGPDSTKEGNPKKSAGAAKDTTDDPSDGDSCYMAPSAESVLKDQKQSSSTKMSETDESPSIDDSLGGLNDRFASKQWKVRQEAYVEATALFKEKGTDAPFNEFASDLEKVADDSNASANDSGLELIAMW